MLQQLKTPLKILQYRCVALRRAVSGASATENPLENIYNE